MRDSQVDPTLLQPRRTGTENARYVGFHIPVYRVAGAISRHVRSAIPDGVMMPRSVTEADKELVGLRKCNGRRMRWHSVIQSLLFQRPVALGHPLSMICCWS